MLAQQQGANYLPFFVGWDHDAHADMEALTGEFGNASAKHDRKPALVSAYAVSIVEPPANNGEMCILAYTRGSPKCGASSRPTKNGGRADENLGGFSIAVSPRPSVVRHQLKGPVSALAKGCPVLEIGGAVNVYEAIAM